MDNKKQESNVTELPIVELMPIDYAISIHIQNMFATYGEEYTRQAIEGLFGIRLVKPIGKPIEETTTWTKILKKVGNRF
jgi:hypothetical protein